MALAVPLYTAAAAGRLGWSLGMVAFFMCAGFGVRAYREHEPLLPLIVDTLEKASLMVVVVLLGAAVPARRKLAAAAARELAAAAAERERDAARRVTEERLRIARELHDVLAHTIAAVTVQAGVAADVLDSVPADASSALREIRTAARTALEELRTTVGVLRSSDGSDDNDSRADTAPLAPAPRLDQLDTLLSLARRAGVRGVDSAVCQQRPALR